MQAYSPVRVEVFPDLLLVRYALSAGGANFLSDFPKKRSLRSDYMRSLCCCQLPIYKENA